MPVDFARARAADAISTRSLGVAAGLAAFDLGGTARGFVIVEALLAFELGIDFFVIAPV